MSFNGAAPNAGALGLAKTKRLIVTAYTLLVISSISTAGAQSIVEAELFEDFAAQVTVSGTIVAGVVLGELIAVRDPGQIFIKPPPAASAFCFSARTRDGQYWTEGVVSPPENAGEIRLMRKGGWQHSEALERYSVGDFAATVRLSDACGLDANATFLPVRFSRQPTPVLNLAINSQRAIRLGATLLHSDGEVDGECTKSVGTERSTAFNFWCRFDLSNVARSQDVKIVVKRRMRVGPQTDEIFVSLQ